MKPLRKTARELFGLDRRERRGTFILSLILAVMVAVRLIAFRPGEIPEVLPPLAMLQDSPAGGTGGKDAIPVPFIFDPNTSTFEELVSLGLTDRQARTLVNYRGSGARFRRPEDLRRVYGIDSVTAARLIPYIIIKGDPDGKDGARQKGGESNRLRGGYDEVTEMRTARNTGGDRDDLMTETVYKPEAIPIDLNLCTSVELESLPGIGPVLAERIIRYRGLLGGFVDKSQLTEVYGLDTTVARVAAVSVSITFDSVRPLVLDSAGFSVLARHPYIGYEAARLITRYRTVAGTPVTLGKMVAAGVIPAEQAGRIAPYVRPAQGVVGNDYEFISSKVLK